MSLPEENPSVNFLGMGSIEIVTILVIAFLVFGPSKSIEMARTVGKLIRELRRNFSEIASSFDVDLTHSSRTRPTPPTSRSSEEDRPPENQA